MITDKDCISKWGLPEPTVTWESKTGFKNWTSNTLSITDARIYAMSTFPNRIYMNEILIEPFTAVVKELIATGLLLTIKSFNGCFYIRRMKTIKNGKQVFSDKWSLHSFGIAIDIDASWNPQGGNITMNPKIVDIFKSHGFDWGGDFKIKDAMHFQLSSIG